MVQHEELTVLIYEQEPADVKIINYCCKQLGFHVINAATVEEAEKSLHEEGIDLAFINLSLDYIKVPSETKIVTVGEIKTATTLKVFHYRSACFIPKPLSLSAIMLGLQKASSSRPESGNFIGNLVNTANTLNKITYDLQILFQNPQYKTSFNDSINEYCLKSCVLSKKKEELCGDDQDYEIISYFSDQGALYCRQKDDCKLHKYHQLLNATHPSVATKSAIDVLRELYRSPQDGGIMENFQDLCAEYDSFVNDLYELKRKYCLKKCSDRVDGLGYKQGDNIHVDSKELLSGVSVFCSESKCPLDNFFELFRRKII